MVGLNLLFEAIACGLSVSTDGERVVVCGPRRLAPLAMELLAHKASVMRLLQKRPELAELDPFSANVLYVFDGEITNHDAETVPWGCRGVPAPTGDGDVGPRCMVSPRAACFTCRGTRRWRLRRLSSGEPGCWICARCHPPQQPPDSIERYEGGVEEEHRG